MAKLDNVQIGAADMLEYLSGYSDFSFELQVLRLIRQCGLECEHGGLYEDPVSKKVREFDIRAVQRAAGYSVHLAIECKNVRENFPLLVSCVPRHESENFHHVFNKRGRGATNGFVAPNIGHNRARSRYKTNAPVGKEMVQIGREKKDSGIFATDSDVFDKWSQCLASADTLVRNAYDECTNLSNSRDHSTVFAFVVVPDNRLWQVNFDEYGNRTSEPTPTDHCSVFVNRLYEVSAGPEYFSISHIDVVTVTGLLSFINDNLTDERYMIDIFPKA